MESLGALHAVPIARADKATIVVNLAGDGGHARIPALVATKKAMSATGLGPASKTIQHPTLAAALQRTAEMRFTFSLAAATLPLPGILCFNCFLIGGGLVDSTAIAQEQNHFPADAEVREAHIGRLQLYEGLQFQYKSSYSKEDIDWSLENLYAITSDSTEQGRHWISYNRDANEPHVDASPRGLVHAFYVFDGTNSYIYQRKYLGSGFSGIPESNGKVYPGKIYEPPENLFALFLEMGVDFINVQAPELLKADYKFSRSGSSLVGGVPVATYTAKRVMGENALELSVSVSSYPECLVLRQHAELNGNTVRYFEISRCERFNGVLFPASGELREDALGDGRLVTYSFDVTKHGETDRSASSIPEWPEGTAVTDTVAGTTKIVEFSDSSRRKVQKARVTSQQSPVRQIWSSPLVVINLLLLLLVASIFTYRHFKLKKSE